MLPASVKRPRPNLPIPKWARTDGRITQLYEIAQKFGLTVDHIIPIKHEQVCGLHVFDNLQLLSRGANSRKGNWFHPDFQWET